LLGGLNPNSCFVVKKLMRTPFGANERGIADDAVRRREPMKGRAQVGLKRGADARARWPTRRAGYLIR